MNTGVIELGLHVAQHSDRQLFESLLLDPHNSRTSKAGNGKAPLRDRDRQLLALTENPHTALEGEEVDLAGEDDGLYRQPEPTAPVVLSKKGHKGRHPH